MRQDPGTEDLPPFGPEPDPATAPNARRVASRSAAERLSKLSDRFSSDEVSVGDVMRALGPSGMGLSLIVLSLPSFVPTPGLPVGFVFGAVLAIVSLQMLVGARRPILPAFLNRRTFPRWLLSSMATRAAPVIRSAEIRLRPRLKLLSGRLAQALLAIPLFVLAVLIFLPIPFGNQLPSIAIIALALGLMSRDGFAVVAGLVLSVIAVAWNLAVVIIGFEIGLAIL